METVKHKIFGEGKIVKRDGRYLTVVFSDGKEMEFAIPRSFQDGILVAEGALNEEVNTAIKEANEKERLEKELKEKEEKARAAISLSSTPKRRTSKGVSKPEITNAVAKDYEAFLIEEEYKVETDSGKPSTVYSYINAIDKILEDEHMDWQTLKSKISEVISLYDHGGAKEDIGNKSNKTFINALKRFNDFLNSKKS